MCTIDRLSTQGITRYKKAATTQLTRQEHEELHFEFLGIVYAFQERLRHTLDIDEPFSLTTEFPRFLDYKKRFEFAISLRIEEITLVKYELLFDAIGPSLVLMDLSGLKNHPEFYNRLTSFTKSAAFKRYFEFHSTQSHSRGVLQTVVPKAQVVSKHLLDYLIHLASQTNSMVLDCRMTSNLAKAA